jgi:hypothetical protein
MLSMSEALRREVRSLVDRLPDEELAAARRYLEYLRDLGADPVLRAAHEAPLDDEDEAAEEADAAKQAREEVARGDVVSTDDLRRRLGL